MCSQSWYILSLCCCHVHCSTFVASHSGYYYEYNYSTMCYIDCTTLLCIVSAAESNLAETAVSTVAAGSVESIDAVESDGGAESDLLL